MKTTDANNTKQPARPAADKLMRWDKLDMLTIHKKDSRGNRAPFFVRYVKKDGGIVESHNVICTSVDRQHGTRRVKFMDTEDISRNAETRTLRDILILQVDNYKIIKN